MAPLTANSVPTVAASEIGPQEAAITRQHTNIRHGIAKTRHLTVVVGIFNSNQWRLKGGQENALCPPKKM